MCECTAYDDRNVVEELRQISNSLDTLCTILRKITEPTVATGAATVVIEPEKPEAKEAEAEELTIEQVRAALSDVAKKPGGRRVIKDALNALGASKLTEVASSDWPKLLEVLDA